MNDPLVVPRFMKPVSLFIRLLLIVFAVETLVMYLLAAYLRDVPAHLQNLIDSLSLSVLSAPFMWWLIVRPFQSESEHRFHSLFENMMEGFAFCQMLYDDQKSPVDFVYLDVNSAFERLTGLKGVVGKKVTEVIPGIKELSPELFEIFGRIAITGEPERFDFDFKSFSQWLTISAYCPEQGYFVAVFDNITERKLADAKLHEKNAELERFTYTISHDLKSPLVTISSFLGYLETDIQAADTDRIRDDVGYIRNAADKMGQLLSELLELSRVGRVITNPVLVGFQEIVQEALQLVGGHISDRGVRVTVAEDSVKLYADRARLVEIWQNLIENAVKYMGDQSVPCIEIGVELLGKAPVFFVRDNGLGIDPRHIDKIFGLFEKLDKQTEGTGLGLALVKRIAEMYGGTVWVESEGLGHGSCFRFTLPDAVTDIQQQG